MVLAKDILISPASMHVVDKNAAQSGILSTDLMERAGAAVAAHALRHYCEALRFIVLCGPGNNGGDGYVAARYLTGSGAKVMVFSNCDVSDLKGDAFWAFEGWEGDVAVLGGYQPQRGDVVIDALFGAGLSRSVTSEIALLIDRVKQLQLPVLSVDLPSGVNGRTGAVMGAAFEAQRTVTFAALKPGHLLEPGRSLCGEVELVDIGIPERILRSVEREASINQPSLWSAALPRLGGQSHKYRRGHLTIFSGRGPMSGAARLSATSALHAGAGIVAMVAPDAGTSLVLANHLTAVMQVTLDNVAALDRWLSDPRHETFVIGPGYGDLTRLSSVLARIIDHRLVLDADALTVLSKNTDHWFARFAAAGTRILTPHEGEFARLFPSIAAEASFSKIEKARAAAKLSNCVVVYKGADSVIAAPHGRACVNCNAPPSLATAGSGDVLAGLCGALLANGVPAFEAACAGVWLHGDAASRGPSNLNAEQLAALVRPYGSIT